MGFYIFEMHYIEKIYNKFIRIVKKELIIENNEFKKKQEDYDYLISCGVETQFGYVELVGRPIIKKHPNSKIIIGKGVILVSDSHYNEAGINHPVIIATEKEGVTIKIGDGCGFSGTSIVAVSGIEIGENTLVGVNSNIWDTDFHPINPIKRLQQKSILDALTLPVKIGRNVWIGANTTILKGVQIDDNSVIGSNSLVNKNVGKNELFAGIPAKFIKTTR